MNQRHAARLVVATRIWSYAVATVAIRVAIRLAIRLAIRITGSDQDRSISEAAGFRSR